MKSVKLIHENLNAGGGAERLAVASLETLKEMNCSIDLITFTEPNWQQLERIFGISKLRSFVNSVVKVDINFLLGKGNQTESSEHNQYDLVMNTHGDILPSNMLAERGKTSKFVTYCHYPLVPELIRNLKYDTVLRNFMEMSKYRYSSLEKLRQKALAVYNQMMNNSTVLTNSVFSSNAVHSLYPSINPKIIYPPVDIEFFSRVVSSDFREDRIIVLGRFNPDKNIELAIEVARLLKAMDFKFEMSIVGNISKSYYPYYHYLEKLIKKYGLSETIELKTNLDINNLLDLFGKSKVLFHPTIGEPFGICVAEAMSAGLIPVVPSFGGNTEFVPQHLRYSNNEEAVKIIIRFMDATLQQRAIMNGSVKKFAKRRFKHSLKSLLNKVW